MPKRPCTNRAQWRLVRGHASQRLSPHYQLQCDYGTAFTAIYKEGDAFFLCDAHATAFNPMDSGAIAGVRVIKSPSSDAKQAKIDLPVQDSEAAAANPEVSAPPVAATGILSDRAPLANVDEPNQNPQHAAAEADHSEQPAAETQSPDNTERPAPLEVIERGEPTLTASDTSSLPELAASPAVESPRQQTVRSSAKKIARDLTFGDCAKALVDEAIWNLPPGNFAAYQTALQQGRSVIEAAEAAGGQLAIVNRRIAEYTAKIDAILSESRATLNASEVVDCPLENAMLEIIENGTLNESEKDAVVDQLGEFQKWITGKHGRQLSPLEAHQAARLIGDRANWGIGVCSVEKLKPAYGIVYKSLRDAVLSAVPASCDMDKRLANLCAARCTLETEFSEKLYSVVT